MKELEKLRQSLRWLDNNLYRMDFNQVRDFLDNQLPRVSIPYTEFKNDDYELGQNDYSGTNVVYRAQFITSELNKPYELPMTGKRLSYIPQDKLAELLKTSPRSYGRVNKPHESIFYGAFSSTTAIIETLHSNEEFLKTGKALVVVGTWKLTHPMDLAEVPLSKIKHDEMHKAWSHIEGFNSKFDEAFFKDEDAHKAGYNLNELDKCVYEFFSNYFCEYKSGSSHYLISNYYADRAFHRDPEFPMPEGGFEGILYPSIANSFQQKNIALLSDVVDAKLKFIRADKVLVIFQNNHISFAPLDKGYADNEGAIHWEKLEYQKRHGPPQ